MRVKQGPVIVGLLAHVDAGKTTLAESLLYKSGAIRKAGRVDHQDAFLDTHALEKRRGITIFSKQAQLHLDGLDVTLLDTPGHADFSAEMERTLQVLDYAVLVISGADGVQGQTDVLWRLLARYRIPTFLFINKMDQDGPDREALLLELRRKLDPSCILFADGTGPDDELCFDGEEIATCDEETLDRYLEEGEAPPEEIRRLIRERKVFPCLFGSALKMTGIDALLAAIRQFAEPVAYGEDFGARVFKVAREGGTRLTYLKVTGGSLKVKQLLGGEKIDQIRLPAGASFELMMEAPPGTVCAVTGPASTYAGQGFGTEEGTVKPVLEPVLTYALILPDGADPLLSYQKLKQLDEEIPELHLAWEETGGHIQAQVMGEVQTEILRQLILERFGMEVSFDAGRIVYRETIEDTVEGVGHFEPLRHYAEVHLVIEPAPRGSGVTLASAVKTDDLDLNWQRLILTHLMEKPYRGVLTGSELTDVKITLTAGRAHLKHTEGGDFRQATYRAVRQGLMQAQSLLLEPLYRFRLEVPREQVGRAMSDVQAMYGTFEGPFEEDAFSVLTGTAPVACMQDYMNSVRAYTGGSGRLTLTPEGYAPCHNAEEVIAAASYDPDADTSDPSGSVFCSHGAGVYIPWDEVPRHMHLEETLTGYLREKAQREDESAANVPGGPGPVPDAVRTGDAGREAGGGRDPGRQRMGESLASDRELMEIFERTYGPAKENPRRPYARSYGAQAYGDAEPAGARTAEGGSSGRAGSGKKKQEKQQVLLVDGYNIIFAWKDLKELADKSLDGARSKLTDILANYRGYRGMDLILVFDAYKVAGGQERCFLDHGIHVVYTKEAETADAYIERTTHALSGKCDVTVATSDGTEQIIIWGKGAKRMSARELRSEVTEACREIQEMWLAKSHGKKRYLFDNLPDDLAAFLEDMRLGRKQRST